ncbi:hypothetical protein [Acidianus bottle-shaped virus]|uniref:Uncharacterized protein ORF37 n=1 Tax=Acidianus bottle-shaped virus (isolate Italy/Pozzuoli) TaxID=654911 RepID=Y037_ABVP|nr:hypothetical protein ABV_gp41 [Acidianus bottle-shaped virus]A4ZUC7.1 RecName: Full=Uncharacterized protein ORF37 [Acidianus bottle-shaped virus (isolate Pozzuoli)]ABP73431.1 hypothetical protein [Acidianus bottle-shaped virus]
MTVEGLTILRSPTFLTIIVLLMIVFGIAIVALLTQYV